MMAENIKVLTTSLIVFLGHPIWVSRRTNCYLCGMFIRRKPNKSGTVSIQVVDKRGGRYVVVKSFGASRDDPELVRMESEASHYIDTYGGQLTLDFQASTPEERLRQIVGGIKGIRQNGVQLLLEPVYDAIGFNRIGDSLLRQLVIARVAQPRSKLATVDYLRRYFDAHTTSDNIYRYMDKLYNTQRELVQQISVEHTRKVLGGRLGIVFYDVTTLYFETAREDALRSPGFSKDGKTAESQVVLGLLVSEGGYPLSYSLFNGKQYEGHTMIPVIDDFVRRFSLTDFIVVADTGLLTRRNITLLKVAGYRFILGGRVRKESAPVQDWVLSLPKDPERLYERRINGDERIIVSYSEKRAEKDAYNRERGIRRLRKAYSAGKIRKENINQRGYNKFLRIEKDIAVSIDEARVIEDAQWDGLKAYITNTDLAPREVVNQYHGLWVVERAFRIAKGTLETRPVFHFTERRIEAHICICFIAYKVYKEFERQLLLKGIGLSVDKVLDIAKTVSTVTIDVGSNQTMSKTLLLTDEQRILEPLLPPT